MGIQNSFPQKNVQHRGYLDDWETVDHLSNFNLVRNIRTNQLGEARKYKLDPCYDPHDELKIYHLRALSDEPIVKAYSGEILQKVSKKVDKQKNSNICANSNHIGVVTQRIQYLLNDIPQLSFSQSIYVLRQSLKGFQHLYPRTGPVHVTNKMIGANKNNQIKVWINEDFSQNHPNYEIRSLLSTRNLKLDREYNMISPQYRDEKQMVQNIVDIVQDICQNKNGEFYNLMRQNCYSFKSARVFLENFARQRQINVPNVLQNRNIQKKISNIEELRRVLNRTNSQLNLPRNQLLQPRSSSNMPIVHNSIQRQMRSNSQANIIPALPQFHPQPQQLNYPRYPPTQNIYPLRTQDHRNIQIHNIKYPQQGHSQAYQPPNYSTYVNNPSNFNINPPYMNNMTSRVPVNINFRR